MNPLIIFDIDGTLANTIKVDDYGFIQTYKNLYDIDLGKADWGKFKHITDLGITRQIFQDTFKRLPTNKEINSIKTHFLALLNKQSQNDSNLFKEVSGAVKFFNQLRNKNYPIAIATGGWEKTALFKLKQIGLNIDGVPFANSNQHYSRRNITQIAIDKAEEKHATDFERIIYFGDGKWDLLNCQEMGIEFIGVDFYGNGKLKNLGAEFVIKDFTNSQNIWTYCNL